MAKYPYIVNKNGIWYPSGTEVPEGAFILKEDEKKETKEYTKTEINRMSTAELQQLAKSEGIENTENITGGELKKILIKKFEL